MNTAHINDLGEKQSVKEHLSGTAERAEQFAESFGCGGAGYLCGLMHDIGKYSGDFQRRIQDPEHVKKVDHSTAGAKELQQVERVYPSGDGCCGSSFRFDGRRKCENSGGGGRDIFRKVKKGDTVL